MPISIIDPISPAIDRTKLILFRPFDINKWLALGFCAFLANLGEGGGGGSANTGMRTGGGNGEGLDPVWSWIQDNWSLFLSIVVAVVAVSFLVGLLLMWLSSRGKFMFVDGIVHNRGAVTAPWGEFRNEGNSLFGFRFLFSLCCLLLFLAVIGGCVLIAMPSIQEREFGPSAVWAMALGIVVGVPLAITAILIDLCLNHFVVPIMYLRRMGVLAAWSVFRWDFLRGRSGTFFLYVLFQILMGMAIGMLALLATCFTCCLTIVPYVGTVILLPLFVFARSYQLYFLEQFGDEWRFFSDLPVAGVASPFGDGR